MFPYIILVVSLYGRLIGGWSVPSALWICWCLLIVLLQTGFRIEIERKDNRTSWIALYQPIANTIMIWILLRSTLKVKVKWKGREFVDGIAQ